MKIFTLWGNRKHDAEEFELITAWDEFSVDANPDGFDEECEKGIASWGTDILDHRLIVIRVPYNDIAKAFKTQVVDGTVEQ